MRYTGTSEDGHPLAGRLSFRVKIEGSGEPAAAATESQGAPASDAATDPAAAESPDGETRPLSDTGSGVPWGAIAAVGAVLVVAVAAFMLRRRAG